MMQAIPSFDGYYATDDGRIYSEASGKFLKQRLNRFGYSQVTLYKDKKPFKSGVHRFVAMAFLGLPTDPKMQVNHKNEIKTDNRPDNLEWCSCSYNINYGNRNAVVSKKQIANKTQAVGRKVEQLDNTTNEIIKVWDSLRSIERELGFSHNNIAACCKGRRKTRGGYKWRYVNDGHN